MTRKPFLTTDGRRRAAHALEMLSKGYPSKASTSLAARSMLKPSPASFVREQALGGMSMPPFRDMFTS